VRSAEKGSQKKKIPFIAHDVSTDPKAKKRLQELGYTTVPVTIVNDEKHFAGVLSDEINALAAAA
jgi:glutaredoxin